MEGILALMIPVLALATGLVAVMRMPPEALAEKRLGRHRRRHGLTEPAADNTALEAEVALLREEMAQMRERLDFTERLLMDAPPAAARLSAAEPAPAARAADA
jgi:hypothetical protein